MTSYRVIDAPDNGTSGQHVGDFSLAELPERLRRAIEAAPDEAEWILPALSEGDHGKPLDGLHTVVRRD